MPRISAGMFSIARGSTLTISFAYRVLTACFHSPLRHNSANFSATSSVVLIFPPLFLVHCYLFKQLLQSVEAAGPAHLVTISAFDRCEVFLRKYQLSLLAVRVKLQGHEHLAGL